MIKIYTFTLLIILFGTQFCHRTKDNSKLTLIVLLYLNSQTISAINPSPSATKVYGQNGSFTSNGANNGGITADSLFYPKDIVTDLSGGVYISDSLNSRVLYYPLGSTTATKVYGQNGSFTSNVSNNGGITANSLSSPFGLALDAMSGLYISDHSNSRVLYYPLGSTTATRVYGQNGSFTSNDSNNGGLSATSLQGPSGIALDSNGGLYVSDDNHRVLYYASGSTTATRVYGQKGSFTTATKYFPSADSLAFPGKLAIDSKNGLYIADSSYSRVLYYPPNSTAATKVYGKNGSFTSAFIEGVNSNTLSGSGGVKLDPTNGLYVTDYDSNRVLYYPSDSTTAIRVYGQAGSFTSNAANNAGVSSKSLDGPDAITLDSSGRVFIADYRNHRVLYY